MESTDYRELPMIETTEVEQEPMARPVSGAQPRPPARQVVFLMLAGSIVAATSLAIIGILTGECGEAMGRAFGSTAACFAYGFLALVGTYRIGQRRTATLANASVVASVIGLGTSVLAIWAEDSANLGKLATVGFIAAFATAHASFLQARRRETDHSVVRKLVSATHVFIAIAAIMLCILVVSIEDVGEGFGRTLAIVLLIDMMLNVLVPIVRRAIRGGVSKWATHGSRIRLIDLRRNRRHRHGSGAAGFCACPSRDPS